MSLCEELRKYLYNPWLDKLNCQGPKGIWKDINTHFKELYLQKGEKIKEAYKNFINAFISKNETKKWLNDLCEKGMSHLAFSFYNLLFKDYLVFNFSLAKEEKSDLSVIDTNLYMAVEKGRPPLKTLRFSRTSLSLGRKRPIMLIIFDKDLQQPKIEIDDMIVRAKFPKPQSWFGPNKNVICKFKELKEKIDEYKGQIQKLKIGEEIQTQGNEKEEEILNGIEKIIVEIKNIFNNNNIFNNIYNNYLYAWGFPSKYDTPDEIVLDENDFIDGFLFTYVLSCLTGMNRHYIPSVQQRGEPSAGLFIVGEKELDKESIYTAQDIINRLSSVLLKYESTAILERTNRLAAGAAILVESYAHNIGAHSLANIKNLIGKDKFEEELFFTYLKDKSAFWNAVSRGGILWGGEIKNLWDVFSEFMRNTLLCKSIGKDEGWEDVKFIVKSGNDPWELGKSQDIFENLKLIKEKSSEEISKMLKECPKLRALINCRDALINYNVFLPEGVVGQQALYTIIENILRNVKHLQRPNGCCDKSIPFHIEIKDEGSDFYEISFWIDFPQKDVKSKEELEKHIREKMDKWGILREDKSANMGGLSQNILCSGMLLGYDFLETERQFVEVEEKNGGKKKLIDFEVIEANNKHCCVVWKVKLWKGENVISWSEYKKKTQGEEAPLGRYRIVTYQDEEEKNELLWKSTFIRCVKKDNNEDFGKLYEKWVNEFVKKIYPQGLCIRGEGFDRWCFFSNKVNGDCCTEPQTPRFWFFHHPSDTPKDEGWILIRIRKDGVMAKFQGASIITPGNEPLKSELLEIMGVKMDIFDNRIFGEFENLENNQQELLKNLGVDCYKEEEFEEKKNNLNRKHFLVIHLSLIESLTNKRDSEAIKEFWKRCGDVLSKYDFIIVTTGRGRQWLERFKGENTPDDFKEIGRKLRYTPVENLEKCFERAKDLEPYSPAMGIKYALVKALIGS